MKLIEDKYKKFTISCQQVFVPFSMIFYRPITPFHSLFLFNPHSIYIDTLIHIDTYIYASVSFSLYGV